MKKLLFSLTIMIFAVAYLTGCKQDPGSSIMSMKAPPPPPPNANPAICYVADNNIGTKGNPNIVHGLWVMDATGANSTAIFTSGTLDIRYPIWSPNGGKIAFMASESVNGGTIEHIKTIDVSVVNGVATGSNLTEIYSRSLVTDLESMNSLGWCPNAANNVLVTEVASTTTSLGILRIVPLNGGATTDIVTETGTGFLTPRWSPDGLFIATRAVHGTNAPEIRIYSSTGTKIKAINPATYYRLNAVDWSRTSGKIAYTALVTSTSTENLYTIDTAANANATLISTTTARWPSWSPDDSKIAITNGQPTSSPIGTVVVATGALTDIHTPGNMSDWKR